MEQKNHKGEEGMHEGEKGIFFNEEEIIREVLNAAYTVHTFLGAGLLESTYEHCLAYELERRNLTVERQKVMPVVYKEVSLDVGYRIDLLVNGCVIIELKSVESLHALHISQTLTYLRLSACKYGLLINFHEQHLKNGIRRLVR